MYRQIKTEIRTLYKSFDHFQAHSVSLRSNLLETESEPFQLFIASAGSTFDFGAGIPITRRHVLTSATLVRGYLNWNVGFGSSTISKLHYIETQIGFVHPNYNGVSFNNNVAILVLPRPFPTGNNHIFTD